MNDAYAAGFFDGEGCISLFANGKSCISIQVIVGNTKRSVLDIFAKKYGGGVYAHKMRSPKHKQAYQWRICGKHAINFLIKIRKHVILKTPQINLLMQFWSHKNSESRFVMLNGGRAKAAGITEKDLEFKNKMHELNRRGVQFASNKL